MIAAERAAKALAAFDTLCSFDSDMAELMDAKVPRRTILNLYPSPSFLGVAKGLTEHLLSHPHALHVEQAYLERLSEKDTFISRFLWMKMSEELQASRTPDYIHDRDSPELRSLIDLVSKEGEARQFPRFREFAERYAMTLWNSWWYMVHRAELGAREQEAADALMLWCNDLLLVDLAREQPSG